MGCFRGVSMHGQMERGSSRGGEQVGITPLVIWREAVEVVHACPCCMVPLIGTLQHICITWVFWLLAHQVGRQADSQSRPS